MLCQDMPISRLVINIKHPLVLSPESNLNLLFLFLVRRPSQPRAVETKTNRSALWVSIVSLGTYRTQSADARTYIVRFSTIATLSRRLNSILGRYPPQSDPLSTIREQSVPDASIIRQTKLVKSEMFSFCLIAISFAIVVSAVTFETQFALMTSKV